MWKSILQMSPPTSKKVCPPRENGADGDYDDILTGIGTYSKEAQ